MIKEGDLVRIDPEIDTRGYVVCIVGNDLDNIPIEQHGYIMVAVKIRDTGRYWDGEQGFKSIASGHYSLWGRWDDDFDRLKPLKEE